jgi:predicted MFS family arabinose efflux permease
MARDARAAPSAHTSFGAAMGDGRLWRLAAIYGCLVVAFYGVGFWLPQIVQGLSGHPSTVVALISAVPYVAAALGMVAAGASSDRTGERRWHVAGPALVGAAGFLLTAAGPSGVWWSLATLSLAAFGVYSALGPFWALPATLLRGPAAAGGIAVINSFGNLGGFVGPFVVGLVRDRTGSFAGGLAVLAAGLVVGAALTLGLPRGRDR